MRRGILDGSGKFNCRGVGGWKMELGCWFALVMREGL